MKKSILFALKSMNIGGVEKSFISLLKTLRPSDYDIDVLLLENQGGFLESIPSWVRVIPWDGYSEIKDDVNLPPQNALKRALRQKKYLRFVGLMNGLIKYKATKNILHYYKAVFKHQSISGLKARYDFAVTYTSLISYLSYTVLSFVNADRYIGWIHFDLNKVYSEKKAVSLLHKRMYKIFIVSESGRRTFCEAFPELAEKCFVKYNSLDKQDIINRSREKIELDVDDDLIKIVTVSRLSREKGIDLAVDAAAELKEVFPRFKWFIVGGGAEYDNLTREAKLRKIEENVCFLGEKENPLPYVRMCDIYVQPSRMEGYCTTTNEAKVLNKAIVVTDVNGMREQFVENKTALIVPCENPHEIFKAVHRLCLSSDERKELSENIEKYGFIEDREDVNKIFA